MSDDTRMVDVDYLLLSCHDEFLQMEHECIGAVLALYEEVDENGVSPDKNDPCAQSNSSNKVI